MIDEYHRCNIAAQVPFADGQSKAAVGRRIDDFYSARPIAKTDHYPYGNLLADDSHAVGIGGTQRDTLHPLGVRVHVHEGVAVEIDDDQVADVGRSPAAVAIEALTAQVEPFAHADDLRYFGQAIRVGERAQINFAQFCAVLGIDDQQGCRVVARHIRLVGCDDLNVVRVGTIAHRKLSQRSAQIHRVQHQDIILAQAVDDIDAAVVVVPHCVRVDAQQIHLGLGSIRGQKGCAAGGKVRGDDEEIALRRRRVRQQQERDG